jgi:hypothetical protein
MTGPSSPEDLGRSRVGLLVTGTVSMVRPWGVFVDLGLECPGYIDPIHVRDDHYDAGDQAEGCIVDFRERSRVYELRPSASPSLRERRCQQAEADGLG